jgi:DNA-binding beta-propeller fold protein YncE
MPNITKRLPNNRVTALIMIGLTITLGLTGIYSVSVARGDGQDGEVWVTHQAASKITILHPISVLQGGPVETLTLPTGLGPHITTFSPDGKYAYVSGMSNGDLLIIRADDRQIVSTLHLGPAGTHQAKSSPDGSILLVDQIATRTVFQVTVDESSQTWTVVNSLSLAALGKAPICTIFRDDGLRAYVSLLPSGIAIVDVPSMTLLGTLATDGFIACGMIKSQDGQRIFIASAGSGGHLYQMDMSTDTLLDTGHTLGAGSWHSFNISPNEQVGYGTSPLVDQLQIIDMATGTATPLILNPTPGIGNNQPDAIAVEGNHVYVSLRMSGQLAVVDPIHSTVSYIGLEAPSTSVNPANCGGCALHGVTLRPTIVVSGSSSLLSTRSLALAYLAKLPQKPAIRPSMLPTWGWSCPEHLYTPRPTNNA